MAAVLPLEITRPCQRRCTTHQSPPLTPHGLQITRNSLSHLPVSSRCALLCVRQKVAGHFVSNHKQVAFAVGCYDLTHELVIDPTLNYSTYLGGTNNDYGMAIEYGGAFKVAPSGSIYQDEVAGGFDSFAAKITP